MSDTRVTMDKLVALCKTRGFVFPGSDMYGGMANSWDYGPLGVELKNNVKKLWWKMFVQERLDMVGIDAALVMNPKVWEASGHVGTFSDPLVECKECHERYRVDHIISPEAYSKTFKEFAGRIETFIGKKIDPHLNLGKKLLEAAEAYLASDVSPEKLELVGKMVKEAEEIREKNKVSEKIEFVKDLVVELQKSTKFLGLVSWMHLNKNVNCSKCGKRNWSEPAAFNLMMKTWIGPKEDASAVAYFRPETAQAMFVDFPLVLNTSRKRVPFGIAQIGKAFRNEITPGNFIFRTREFEQMEIEYFVHPSEWEAHFDHWLKSMHRWMDAVGIDAKRIHNHDIEASELAHYSKRTVDIEFEYPFGLKELYGLAYRTDFDLSTHAKHSGAKVEYTDPATNEKYVPHVIEPSFGVDRTVLAVLLSAYDEETVESADGEGDTRVVLRLKPAIAPVKVAILPLSKKEELSSVAKPLAEKLAKLWRVDYDETQSIGKRYRRQDEVGTPFCVTVDFDTLNDNAVTVRERDSMKQERVPLAELESYLSARLS